MARRLFTIWAAWTLFAVFSASQNYSSRSFFSPVTWPLALRFAFIDSYVWAALTPAVFWVAGRLRALGRASSRSATIWRTLPMFAAASFLFAVVHLYGFAYLFRAIGLMGPWSIQLNPLAKLHSDILTCCALFGIRFWISRERKAARLETRLATAQLEVLKMQLQPHFLFNTLHAISALMYRDVESADRMVNRLSDFLRLTLDSSGVQEVTVKREMEYLDRYLEIEQVRFGDRLQVRREIDPDTLDLLVPNFALQPLAENAVRHGIAQRAAGGHIEITARRRGGSLEIEVRDDGPGAGSIREGVGIANTRARLTQLYGPHARLDLGNASSGGFRTSLILPAHTEPMHASSDRG